MLAHVYAARAVVPSLLRRGAEEGRVAASVVAASGQVMSADDVAQSVIGT